MSYEKNNEKPGVGSLEFFGGVLLLGLVVMLYQTRK